MDSIIRRAPDFVLMGAIVAATLITAYIHYTLGGMLFMLNAAGYLGLAILLVAPVTILRRLRPLVLFGLAGYTMATIVGWLVMGPYFTLAYITKAVEVVLLGLIALQLYRTREEIVPCLRYLRALESQVARVALRRSAPAERETSEA